MEIEKGNIIKTPKARFCSCKLDKYKDIYCLALVQLFFPISYHFLYVSMLSRNPLAGRHHPTPSVESESRKKIKTKQQTQTIGFMAETRASATVTITATRRKPKA